jgi:RHS repeat-associated protein
MPSRNRRRIRRRASGQSNYNYLRDFDPATGRYVESDPIGLAGGSWSTYAYAGSSPLDQIDYFGLAQCNLVLAAGKGTLQCIPDTPVNASVNIPVSSGNNGGGENCKNNPDCQGEVGRGPIPLGCWQWTDGYTGKANGRVLQPCKGWNGLNCTRIRSHSCPYPFGPAKGPKFCSEGCVTGTVPDIQSLNRLLDAEPGSFLTVSGVPNFLSLGSPGNQTLGPVTW